MKADLAFIDLVHYFVRRVGERRLVEIAVRSLPVVASSGRGQSMSRLPASQRRAIEQHLKSIGITRKTALELVRRSLDMASLESGLGPDSDVELGTRWYRKAHEILRGLVGKYGYTLAAIAGAAAALSPRQAWENKTGGGRNVKALLKVLDALASRKLIDTERGPVSVQDATPEEIGDAIPGAFTVSIAKAVRILRGEDPITVFGSGSQKVKAFYQALLDPDTASIVPIDTWMVRFFLGDKDVGKNDAGKVDLDQPEPKIGKSAADKKKFSKLCQVWSSEGSHPFFWDIFQQVSAERGLSPHQVQAIIWTTIKRVTKRRLRGYTRGHRRVIER